MGVVADHDQRLPLTVGLLLLMTYSKVDVSGARLIERYLKGRPVSLNIKGEQFISCPGHRDRRVGDTGLDHHGAGRAIATHR